MNPWLLGFGILTLETARAEQRIARAMSNPPDHYVTGPLVSVIIPAYNEEGYIQGLLAALQNQSYIDKEIIVVDNLSTDQTPYIAQRMGAAVVQQPDYNIARSRNWGARAARGEVLAFIDADTIPEHNLLEQSVEAICNGAALVYTNKCSHDSRVMSLLRVARGLALPASLNGGGAFVAVPRWAFDSVGGYDESLVPTETNFWIGEDTNFIQRLSEAYPDRVSYLRFSYVGTSARRQKTEGYLNIMPHEREAREEPNNSTSIMNTGLG